MNESAFGQRPLAFSMLVYIILCSVGSTVYAAALDLCKAFDKIDHGKLLNSLIRAGLPKYISSILNNWYSKLSVAVHLNKSLFKAFNVTSGVRQGSTLSPSICNVFINAMLLLLVASKQVVI
jgi:hypothetical protein